ncbi:glutamate receptor 2.2-like [Malania oleifera]|uniref:glutamate receptor 2.2-like n=1 Tax=Malania oleifera TaxID=397392 RepID=UPI0025AEB4FF|nr:glutamate receptor 2.2-like [Malania oleifera]
MKKRKSINSSTPHGRRLEVFSSAISLCLCLMGIYYLVPADTIRMAMAQNSTNSTISPAAAEIDVGVVLDLNTPVGQMGLTSISMALSDFYASHSSYKTRLRLHIRDSKNDVVAAAASALDLIKNVQVQAIIGPSTSMEAVFMTDLGDKAQVPIISFLATSSFLSSTKNPYFIRATQNDSSQVKAISAIVKTFGWREAVPIYVDSDFGHGIIPYLTDALQEIDTRVPYRSVISSSATDDQIAKELWKLMSMQTRVFIVHMSSSLCSRFFSKVKEVGMMSEGYVWIMTTGLTNHLSSLNPSVIDSSMQGVLGVQTYIPKTKEYESFRIRWKTKFQQDNPNVTDAQLNVYVLWAYDAASALARAVEEVGAANYSFQMLNMSGNLTDLDTFGISQTGPKLLQAILNTKFKGLSGSFKFVDGQLQSSVYQIVNVVGSSARRISFWTVKNGIARELNSTSTNLYSTPASNRWAIIWPGESTSPPKGWVIPTNGKRLRIGVPVKDGFNEFVKVTKDPSTNVPNVTGYCIDVFNAVMDSLPYSVRYDFIPYAKPDGQPAGSYNDLIYQVYIQKFDAVVGDTTIIASRTKYVDFTLPYTESGVTMIVPIIDNRSKNAWVFLKPLTLELWMTSFFFFIFIGSVIWVLEHRINEDFRGPPSNQAGVVFWFSFSTMVFAHKEKVVSNLARFVVIVWVFVVLTLTQSYTASLTSMLTVQQLQPTVTDINYLIKKGEYVGYQRGSFIVGLLRRMNFDESKLRVYDTLEGLDEALSKGSANGGIAAAFDEIPFMKLFLAKYCSKYTMVQPTYKTDGFGFVFPRGSPLVSDVSRAVLDVTEGDLMVKIEAAYFGQASCPGSSTSVSSNNLGLDSFWGLFLIAGTTSSFALIIFTSMFLYDNRDIFKLSDPEASIRSRIVEMARRFDCRDLTSHIFRKSELHDGIGGAHVADGLGTVEAASPRTNYPPSPSSFSNHSDLNFPFREQGTPSAGYGTPSQNSQASQEIVPTIELSDLNQERQGASETEHESN